MYVLWIVALVEDYLIGDRVDGRGRGKTFVFVNEVVFNRQSSAFCQPIKLNFYGSTPIKGGI